MEQKLPTRGAHKVPPYAKEKINRYLDQQNRKGYLKYNTQLETWNNRDVTQDLFEEIADLVNYASQIDLEYKQMRGLIYEIVDNGYLDGTDLRNLGASEQMVMNIMGW